MEIGFIIGLVLGGAIALGIKRDCLIKAAPEIDLIAELKRRRFEARLKQETDQSVNKDLEG